MGAVKEKSRSRKTGQVPAAPSFLHVGCGKSKRENLPPYYHNMREVRLDISPTVDPDIVADMKDLSVVGAEKFDRVFSSHNLEHVFAHEVVGVLRQFYDVLKPGGIVDISVPDLQQLGEALAKGDLEKALYNSPAGPITPLDMFYGLRSAVGNGHYFMAHKTGFTAGTLAEKLNRAGFDGIRVIRYKYNLNAFAVRPEAEKTQINSKFTYVLSNMTETTFSKDRQSVF